MYLLAVAGLIACKDVSLFETFSCPCPPSSTFCKLLEIVRKLELGDAKYQILVQEEIVRTLMRLDAEQRQMSLF